MKVLLISLLFMQFINLIAGGLDTYYKTYIQQFGYKLEENSVTTDDGYILSIWHLRPKVPNGKITFMQHGLAETAWTFFELEKNSLPFLLLKEGFDIRLGNIRGISLVIAMLQKIQKFLKVDIMIIPLII